MTGKLQEWEKCHVICLIHSITQQTKAKAEALKKPSQPKAGSLKEGEKKGEEGSVPPTVTNSTATATASADKGKPKPRADKDKDKRKEKEDKDKKLTAKPSLAQQPVSDIEFIVFSSD